MRIYRVVLMGTAAAVLLLGACGSDGDDATTTSSTTSDPASTTTTDASSSTTTDTAAPTTTDASSSTTTDTAAPTTTDASSSTSTAPTLNEPVLWPASSVVFDSPVDAAADFVDQVLRVPPDLGEFRPVTDGTVEIDVRMAREGGGGEPIVRSVLTVRQLGPDNGWYVVAAANESNTIGRPRSGAEVRAGDVEVAGLARGFEATVIVEAYVAGDTNRIDQQITQGGATGTPLPYSAVVDLGDVASGQTVVLLVKGGVGLETDPGEFSAIPVIIE